MEDPSTWADAIVKIGPFGVLAVLCVVCIYIGSKVVIPWLERKDNRHAETIKAITAEYRESLGEQATEFRSALNHNTSAMNNLADEIKEVRGAVENLGDRLDKHEAHRAEKHG